MFSVKRSHSEGIDWEHLRGRVSYIMKTEEQDEGLVDLDTVESVLSYLRRFGNAPGCVPSHGFKSCAEFGRCCSEKRESTAEE
jgi:hypothetical protein